MRGMGELNDRFDVYSAHLGNAIADTTKQCDRATLQCKYHKFTEANILLRSAFLVQPFIACKNIDVEKLRTRERASREERVMFNPGYH